MGVAVVEGLFFEVVGLVELVLLHAVGWDLSSRNIFHRLNEIRFTEVLIYHLLGAIMMLLIIFFFLIIILSEGLFI